MRLHNCIFILLVALCSCTGGLAPNVEPVVSGERVIPTVVSVIMATPESQEAVVNEFPPTMHPVDMLTTDILTATLDCADYAGVQWGTDLNNLGHCPAKSEAWIRGPYAPQMDEQGNIFVFDKINQRIVGFSDGRASHVISIPSSYTLNAPCEYSNYPGSNIAVSKDRLFFVFSTYQETRLIDQLAVFSLDGREQQIVDLEPYYPLHSIYLNSLVSDREGGVYLLLPPVGVIHFDADFRSELYYMGRDDLLSYEGFLVGWDRNLYIYNAESDSLVNWGTRRDDFRRGVEPLNRFEGIIGSTSIVSPTYTRLLGVDTKGQFYFKTWSQGKNLMLVRFSAVGDKATIITLPQEEDAPYDVAPDGSLYGLLYDVEDFSVQPRIVRCVLSQG